MKSSSMGLLLFALLVPAAFGADEKTKKAAREVVTKYENAVVTVKFAGSTYPVTDGKPGAKANFKAEAAGTVVTEKGLTAVCNFSTDFESQSASIQPVEGGPPTKVVFEITDIKIVLKDGKAIPAELVLRDDKIGVAFVAPKERDQKLDYVPLKDGTPLPEVLDDVIVVSRLGEPLKRKTEVVIGPVSAVMKEANAFVLQVLEDGGCAVFDAAGQPLGVAVLRRGRDQKNVNLDSPISIIAVHADALRPAIAEAVKKWEADKK